MRWAGITIVLVIAAGCGKNRDNGPPPSDTPPPGGSGGAIPLKVRASAKDVERWTYKELVEHFKKTGLRYKFLIMTHQHVVSGYLVPEQSPFNDWTEADTAYRARDERVVYSVIKETPQDAKQEAEDVSGLNHDEAFASGRFVFRGPPRALPKFKEVLP